jgi:predicted RNase H-like nuclease (RuvC/YqgF family)
MVIKLFISGEDKQKNQLIVLKEKISKLDHHLKYHTDKVRSLENRKNELSILLKEIEDKQSSIKKARNRARYLVRKYDFLTLEYDDYDYWIESSSPVHMDKDGQWNEDSDYYIDAGDRHIHVEDDNSHWLDIANVCERIVKDAKPQQTKNTERR